MIPQTEMHGVLGPDGVTEFTLTARSASVRIGAEEVHLLTYNGTLPGPTLHALL